MTLQEAQELFNTVPGLTLRAMFGGHSFYSEGRIFAIHHEGDVYLKGDDQSIPDYLESGGEIFTYLGSKGVATMKYFKFPSNKILLANLDAALETAQRAPMPKPKPPKRLR